MKAIVIGSSGFIGKHLVTRLKAEGYNVEEVHHGNPLTFTSADYIFYLSSYGNHYNQKDKYQTVQANILDYINLLSYIKDMDYKGLIHFSTSSVTLPVQTLYSETKYIAEMFSKRHAKRFNKPIVSVRPYSVYGTGEASFRFIPTIINKLKTGKTLKLSHGYHDWIHISDFIEGLMIVVDNIDKLKGKAIEIGTGKQYSNLEIANKLERISGKTLKVSKTKKLREYDTDNWCANTTVLKGLGWKQYIGIDKGLKVTYEQS